MTNTRPSSTPTSRIIAPHYRELQHEPSATRTGSHSTWSTRSRGSGSIGGGPAPVAADWSSNSTSTLLELPQIGNTPASAKVWITSLNATVSWNGLILDTDRGEKAKLVYNI